MLEQTCSVRSDSSCPHGAPLDIAEAIAVETHYGWSGITRWTHSTEPEGDNLLARRGSPFLGDCHSPTSPGTLSEVGPRGRFFSPLLRHWPFDEANRCSLRPSWGTRE